MTKLLEDDTSLSIANDYAIFHILHTSTGDGIFIYDEDYNHTLLENRVTICPEFHGIFGI